MEGKLTIITPNGQELNTDNFYCIKVIDRYVMIDSERICYSSHVNAMIAWEQMVSDVKSKYTTIKMLDDTQATNRFVQLNKKEKSMRLVR